MTCIDDDLIAVMYPPGKIAIPEDIKLQFIRDAKDTTPGRDPAFRLAQLISRHKRAYFDNRKRPK
jgi:hypothetical protein